MVPHQVGPFTGGSECREIQLATSQPQRCPATNSVTRNGGQTPMLVCTRPVLQGPMYCSADSTRETNGPHSGHLDVPVGSSQAADAGARISTDISMGRALPP